MRINLLKRHKERNLLSDWREIPRKIQYAWNNSDLVYFIFFLLYIPFYFVDFVKRRIEERRRCCPLHKVLFRYESHIVSEEEARANEEWHANTPTVMVTYCPIYIEHEEKEFPNAHPWTLRPTSPGKYTNRYCPACRAAKRRFHEYQELLRNGEGDRFII